MLEGGKAAYGVRQLSHIYRVQQWLTMISPLPLHQSYHTNCSSRYVPCHERHSAVITDSHHQMVKVGWGWYAHHYVIITITIPSQSPYVNTSHETLFNTIHHHQQSTTHPPNPRTAGGACRLGWGNYPPNGVIGMPTRQAGNGRIGVANLNTIGRSATAGWKVVDTGQRPHPCCSTRQIGMGWGA